MIDIKIYSYCCLNGEKIILLEKDNKFFLRIYEEKNQISYITSSNEKRISNNQFTNMKQIDLYEFVFSEQLNDLILNPKKEVKYYGDNTKNKLEEVKEYFKSFM